jgi:Lar family restriction alleviation protein
MEHLLPCPFCGEDDVKVARHPHAEAAGDYFTVACRNSDCYGITLTASTEDEARLAWNTRAPGKVSADVLALLCLAMEKCGGEMVVTPTDAMRDWGEYELLKDETPSLSTATTYRVRRRLRSVTSSATSP